jgi:hypothetical protein
MPETNMIFYWNRVTRESSRASNALGGDTAAPVVLMGQEITYRH